MDFSQIDNLIVNLGTNGQLNLGTLDGNPGPQAGATVVNQLQLANLSNSITAGAITVGAGGRQLTPDLRLSSGTNIFYIGSLNIGTGGRDGGQMEFYQGSGGLTVRGAAGGSSRAEYNQGVNTTSGTAAGFTTTVDLTGGAADLLFDAMVIGNEPVRAANSSLAFGWANTFTFNQGTLNANSVSLSGGCLNGTTGASTMNITGGTASLGNVSLTTSFAPGTLNISGNATVTVSNITSAGSGGGTLTLDSATLNISMGASGNPVIAPVAATSLQSASDTVNLGFSGSGFTPERVSLDQLHRINWRQRLLLISTSDQSSDRCERVSLEQCRQPFGGRRHHQRPADGQHQSLQHHLHILRGHTQSLVAARSPKAGPWKQITWD